MGALTLKSFPFELRGWDLEKFEGVDPTDSFGLKIKVCINNKQIIQIEPSFNQNHSTWINDKSRQFFDSLTNNSTDFNDFSKSWANTKNILYKTIYFFELCNLKYYYTNFFIIIYENLSVTLLCLLSVYCQKYSFIKLKKSEKKTLNNNLESGFLLNRKLNSIQIKNSSLCLLISTNVRLEGSALNLKLKQKIIKGNFKLFTMGSSLNLTYNTKFLGKTHLNILKLISEGVHFVCQDFKCSKNPILILNSELFKRNDGFSNLLSYLNYFKKTATLNTLNATLFETGIFYVKRPAILNNSDLTQFSSIHFINTTSYSKNSINKILKTNLIYLNKQTSPCFKKVYLNQNFYKSKKIFENCSNKTYDKYIYLPTKMFFETKETYLSAEGLIKSTNELISKNQKKSGWKIIRKIFNLLKANFNILNTKTFFKINSNLKNNILKIFINLNYQAFKNLNKNNNSNNVNSFFLKNTGKMIKIKKIKFFNTKIKFWLNDFFTGGKDEFSKNSIIMIKCSNANRLESSNFF